MALDSVLASHPHLKQCVTHCCHCGVRFLTHPRNAGRQNLRCPFGCREHRRRRESSRRSTAYYQSAAGKAKKKRLNAKRNRGSGGNQAAASEPAEPVDSPKPQPSDPPEVELRLGPVILTESTLRNSSILPQVRMVASLIEGRNISRQELIEALCKRLRQHSIACRFRRQYVLGFLNQHPP